MSTVGERRAEVLRIEQERAAERQRALDAQSAPHTAPDERIRIWERLHALSLPLSSSHPLLRVIARQTGLPLHELRAEQQRRLAERMGPLLESS